MIGGGRSKPEPLTESVSTTVTPTDKTRLVEAARKRKTSMAALVREAIREALEDA
jgi:predicted HicB family RNase H-like nuclease